MAVWQFQFDLFFLGNRVRAESCLALGVDSELCDSEIKQAFCEDLEHSFVHEVSDLLQNKIDLSLLVITKHPRHALWCFFGRYIAHNAWVIMYISYYIHMFTVYRTHTYT